MTTLRRTLGLTDLVLIVIGTVIGSGIFRVPSSVLQQTGGSVGLSLLVWFAAGVLSLLGALTFAEMGAAKPDAGGLYVFIRDALGPLPAFLYGWTMFLVIASGSCATLAVAFKDYLGAFVTLPPLAGKLVAIAMIAVLWAYEGWQYVTFSAGETKDPQRIFPRGIVLGTGLVIAIYVIANIAYVAAIGPQGVMASQRVAADAVSALFGATAGKFIAAIILVSMFSAANGLTLTAPRLYYSMARDGVFFSKLAEVDPRFNTPAIAIIASSVWAMVLVALPGSSFEQLLTYVVFVGWIFFALAALAIFFYRRREPNLERPFRTPGYPLTPILFVLSAAAIVLNTVFTQPKNVIFAIVLMLLGVPAYFVWRGRGRTRVPVSGVSDSSSA